MHPMERLRYVARTSGADPSMLVRQAAAALADVVRVEPVGLVPACRRLIERHVTTGPVWWLAARMLTASDPVEAAWAAAAELEDDPTSRLLAAALPDEGTVMVVGWPDLAAASLRRRGDLEVLVVDAIGEGSALAPRLRDTGMDVALVPDSGVAAAAVVSGLVVIEAFAAGPTGVLAVAGSHSAAAVAGNAGIPVWAVVGVGRALPGALWDALLSRLDEDVDEPWDRGVELVPAGLITATAGPQGLTATSDGLGQTSCPVAPELLRHTS
jgi:hypothetical protein